MPSDVAAILGDYARANKDHVGVSLLGGSALGASSDIDIDLEVEGEGETDISPQAEAENCPFAKIKDLYHKICISYPKLRSEDESIDDSSPQTDGNRKKAIAARWRTYKSLDIFEELFQIAESSSFLKGNNDRNWSADFDWMMKPTNFSKILEHKYDDKTENGGMRMTGALGTLQKMYEEAQE